MPVAQIYSNCKRLFPFFSFLDRYKPQNQNKNNKLLITGLIRSCEKYINADTFKNFPMGQH